VNLHGIVVALNLVGYALVALLLLEQFLESQPPRVPRTRPPGRRAIRERSRVVGQSLQVTYPEES
jgi:hypothetical protein